MRTLNDWFKAAVLKKEFSFTQAEMEHIQETDKFIEYYFIMDATKCCNCLPILRHCGSIHNQLSYAQCLVCGRKTEPVEDYSWQKTKFNWEQMMKREVT